MKRNISFAVAIGLLVSLAAGVALSGLPGCTPVTTNQESSNQESSKEQQEITLSGSGTAYRALRLLAKAYEEKVPNTKIVFNPSNQTSGGVQGVKDNVIDLGATSRKLTPEEISGIEYRAVAQDALMMATHTSVEGVKNLQTEELKAIYSGKATNWQEFGGPDADIIVLDRAEDETAKILLRRHYFGPDLQVTSDAVLMQKEKDAIESLQTTPYTIGPMSLVRAIKEQLPVNRLSLDGVEPSLENIRNGQYKMLRTIGIVWQGEPTAPVADFIDFLLSEAAAQKLQEAGYATMN